MFQGLNFRRVRRKDCLIYLGAGVIMLLICSKSQTRKQSFVVTYMTSYPFLLGERAVSPCLAIQYMLCSQIWGKVAVWQLRVDINWLWSYRKLAQKVLHQVLLLTLLHLSIVMRMKESSVARSYME